MKHSLFYAFVVTSAISITAVASRVAVSSGQGTALVRLQSATPGTPQTGNANLTGTLIAGQHQGGGAGLTGLNATNISSGTVADARLSSNVTLLATTQTFSALKIFGASFQIPGGGGAGKFLMSDGAGVASWSFLPAPTGTAGGDLSGSYPNPLVDGLQGRAVASTAPATGQVLGWNGTAWTPANDGMVLPFTGSVAVAGNAFSVTNTNATGRGVFGSSPAEALYGSSSGSTTSSYGIYGINTFTGNSGAIGGINGGASGLALSSGTGVLGTSVSGKGVWGTSNSSYGGYFSSTTGTGVYGIGSDYAGYFEGRGYFSGRVGIGIVPLPNDNFLGVAGSVVVDALGSNNGGNSNALKFGTDSSGEFISSKRTAGGNNNGLDFSTGGSARLSIRSNGMVGIGAALPTHRLEVIETTGMAIYAEGNNRGLETYASGTTAVSVFGQATSATGPTIGGYFHSNSSDGKGVSVFASASTGATYGGYFRSNSNAGTGVFAEMSATTGTTFGVSATIASPSGVGVRGESTATTGDATGVYGQSASSTGKGVYAVATGTGYGAAGVFGAATASTGTIFGGNFVSNSSSGIAAVGQALSASGSTTAIYGLVASPTGWSGVFDGGMGVQIKGGGGSTQLLVQPGKWYGVDTANKAQIDIPGTGDLLFWDNVHVNNVFTAGSKLFEIDHPLDPLNKFLRHACIESNELKNLYDGVVTTDAKGYATITVPDWFTALNEKFRYQVTVLEEDDSDDFVMAKVARKLKDGAFVIRTNKPGVEVSWQITGVRKDAFAKANPLIVEDEKPKAMRGKYLHPDAVKGARP